MGLSRLSEKCRKCNYVDTCNHKRMEALAYISEASSIGGVNVEAHIIRSHEIKIDTNIPAAIENKIIKKITDDVNASFNIFISTYR